MLSQFMVYDTLADVYAHLAVVFIFAFILGFVAPATISFLIACNVKKSSINLSRKTLLSLLATCSAAIAVSTLLFLGRLTIDVAQASGQASDSIEQVYDVTKIGGHLVFNRKIQNSIFIENVSIDVEREDSSDYTFIRNNRIYQISKSAVKEY